MAQRLYRDGAGMSVGHAILLSGLALGVGAALADTAYAAPACPINPPPLSTSTHGGPETTLVADQSTVDDDTITATGDVRIERQDRILEAPHLRYDRDTTRIHAEDGLDYVRPDLYLSAASGNLRTRDDTGEFEDADYTLRSNGGHGEAAHARAEGDGHFTLTDAYYTTCSPGHEAWRLSASRIKIDRDAGRGESFNTVLHFYGMPIFYSPYLNFPIDDRRHSGMLVPTVGNSTDSGYELTIPWYFNLAPNYDATLVPRFMTRRGLQLSGQFRYLTRHHRGEFNGSWLPHDRVYGDTRTMFDYRHRGRIGSSFGIRARFEGVSDDDYFEDLSTDLGKTSETHLERTLELSYVNTGTRLTILTQGFQNLSRGRPYKRLPQIRLELNSPTAPFRIGMDTEFTAFRDGRGVDARRTDVHPHINWGIDHGGWFANSELGLHYTRYRFDGRDDISRSIPSFTLGGGLRFSRDFASGWMQTLEPQFAYQYTGYEDQSSIPLFDTGVPDLYYDSLFLNRRYIGSDRIADVNQLALGVSTRLLEPHNGRTKFRLDIGRVLAFTEPRVEWQGSEATGFSHSGSDYVVAGEYRPTDNIRTGFSVQYNPSTSTINRAVTQVDYRSDSGYRLNLAWRRYRNFRPMPGNRSHAETLEQIGLGLEAPISDSMDLFGRWNYSLEKNQSVQQRIGIEYRPSCCWATRLTWDRHVAHRDGSYTTALLFQFILRGLGSFGN